MSPNKGQEPRDGQQPQQQIQGSHTRSRQQLHCPLCDRVFHKNEHLNRHVVSHTKEKRFRCRLCPKVYSRRDSLLRHARIHSQSNGSSNDAVESPPLGPARSSTNRGSMKPDHARAIPPQSVGNNITAAYPPTHLLPLDSNPTAPALNSSVSPLLDQPPSEAPISLDPDLAQPLHYQAGARLLGPAPQMGVQTAMQTMNEPIMDTLQTFGSWDPGSEPWLFGEEFDFNAVLNTYFATDFSNGLLQTSTAAIEPQSSSTGQARELFPGFDRAPSPGRRLALAELWDTRPATSPVSSRDMGPSFDKGQLDENYRHHLSGKLRPSLRDGTLPPASFLNLCLKLFFLKFNPVFPLIHAPTFRPKSENALLVLSICSIGALFVGTKTAAKQGRDIFVRLNKAILASWEGYVYKGGSEALHIAQAVILGQTFGMMSGNSSDLFMTNSFHGTIISWARQTGMLPAKRSEDTVKGYDSNDVNARWKAWAQAEETIRFTAAIFVHDCEFATFLHTAPFLRHNHVEKLPRSCSDELFAATTAPAWQIVFDREQERRRLQAGQAKRKQSEGSVSRSPSEARTDTYSSYLRSYVYLSSIIASISDAKHTSDYPSQMPAFSQQLYAWRYQNRILASRDSGVRTNTYLIMLWHQAYLVLYTDLECVERAVGRKGPNHTEDNDDGDNDEEEEERMEWRTPGQAARAVLHALLNFKQLEVMPAGLEPAIHVPKTLFHSGLVMFRFLRLADPSSGSGGMVYSASDFADSEFLGLPGLTTAEACMRMVQTVDVSVVSSIIDLLRSLGHFEISRQMAMIMEALVDELIIF